MFDIFIASFRLKKKLKASEAASASIILKNLDLLV
jgi:hypothetical protein